MLFRNQKSYDVADDIISKQHNETEKFKLNTHVDN